MQATVTMPNVFSKTYMNQDDFFVLIEASKLSLDDEFLQHIPTTKMETAIKKAFQVVISQGVKNFYAPIITPSFTEDHKNIYYIFGGKPAVGMTKKWWEKIARKFNPARRSRLGKQEEYIAYLAVLIKKLVNEKKWPLFKAWNVVCNNSAKIAHYWDSKDAKREFEPTGSREFCGFYDHGNVHKILLDTEETDKMLVAGGDYVNCGDFCPIACIFYEDENYLHIKDFSSGWVIYEI